MASLGAAGLMLAAAAASGQEGRPPDTGPVAPSPTYKCVARGKVTYSQTLCPGGRELGPRKAARADKTRPVPQDRARIARRATLSPEDRRECTVLDARLAEQKAALQAMPAAPTLADEMPMVHTQKRFRELRC